MVWYFVVLCGVVWYGVVWCGVVWFGLVCGLMWNGVDGLLWCASVLCYNTVWYI